MTKTVTKWYPLEQCPLYDKSKEKWIKVQMKYDRCIIWKNKPWSPSTMIYIR